MSHDIPVQRKGYHLSNLEIEAVRQYWMKGFDVKEPDNARISTKCLALKFGVSQAEIRNCLQTLPAWQIYVKAYRESWKADLVREGSD